MSELTEAQEMLAAYTAAEKKVLEGQSYSFRGRMVTRVDLAELQKGRQYWQIKVNQLNGVRRFARITFTD